MKTHYGVPTTRMNFPAVYLLHGMGGSPEGSVRLLQIELEAWSEAELCAPPDAACKPKGPAERIGSVPPQPQCASRRPHRRHKYGWVGRGETTGTGPARFGCYRHQLTDTGRRHGTARVHETPNFTLLFCRYGHRWANRKMAEVGRSV
jgi:hypothetical protein